MILCSADTWLKLFPALFETYRPPAFLSKSLSINAYTLSEFAPLTAIAILPISFGKPVCNFSQLAPPSVDLYKPLPAPPLITFQGNLPCSHMAAYNMLGFFASIDNSAQPVLSLMYKIFFHVVPPSVLL